MMFSCSSCRHLLLGLLLGMCIFALPAEGQSYRDGAIMKTVETPHGEVHFVYRIPTPKSVGAAPSFMGDTYSIGHEVGANIGGIFQCFDVHMTGTGSNLVTFDGITEALDTYTTGTDPFVSETETQLKALGGGNTTTATINTASGGGGDLFPDGFVDPDTNTPLKAACLEIGRTDTLDPNDGSVLEQATLELSDSNAPLFPPIDITFAFSNPFDGRLSVVFPNLTGLDIDRTELVMQIEPDPMEIFSDGFEQGNTSSWATDP